MASCPNCNQVVLPADTVCWQCGYRLSPQPAQSPVTPETATAVTPTEPFSLSAVLVYGGLTAVLIILLSLTMRSLGQQPRILLNPDTEDEGNWLPVTDRFLNYTFDIPPDWESFERLNFQQRPGFDALLESHRELATAVAPLSTLATDTSILMVVISEQPEQGARLPAFVIVAQSEAIGRFTLDDITLLAQRDNPEVTLDNITRFHSFVGDERLALTFKLPQTPDQLLCQQHLITSEGVTYIVAGCAPENRYSVYNKSLEAVLASFQLLR